MGNVDNSLYDSDFYLWTQQAAERLRAGDLSADDLARAAEEIADMGKRDRRELQSRTIVLVINLMKWAAQPHLRQSSTWLDTITGQRIEIEAVLEQSPSLRPFLLAELPDIFVKAALRASVETKLPIQIFRLAEPDLEKLLFPAYFPDDIGSL